MISHTIREVRSFTSGQQSKALIWFFLFNCRYYITSFCCVVAGILLVFYLFYSGGLVIYPSFLFILCSGRSAAIWSFGRIFFTFICAYLAVLFLGRVKRGLCFKGRAWFFFIVPALFGIQNSAYFHTFCSNRSGYGNARENGAELTRIPAAVISTADGKGLKEASSFFWQACRSSYWTYKFGKEAIIIECFFTSRALTFHILYGTSSFFLCKFPISAFYFSIYRPYTG